MDERQFWKRIRTMKLFKPKNQVIAQTLDGKNYISGKENGVQT